MHPQNDQTPAPKPDRAKPSDVAGEAAHIVSPEDDEDLGKKPKSTDEHLDHGLKETFPASDPVSINPGAD